MPWHAVTADWISGESRASSESASAACALMRSACSQPSSVGIELSTWGEGEGEGEVEGEGEGTALVGGDRVEHRDEQLDAACLGDA